MKLVTLPARRIDTRPPKIEDRRHFEQLAESVLGKKVFTYIDAVRADAELRARNLGFVPRSLFRFWYRFSLPEHRAR